MFECFFALVFWSKTFICDYYMNNLFKRLLISVQSKTVLTVESRKNDNGYC